MKAYLEAIKRNLTEEERSLLLEIYEPTAVAVQPADANRGLCVTDDGEIRIYGVSGKSEPDDEGYPVYISSRDGGLSWKKRIVKDRTALGAAGVNHATGRYISTYPNEYRRDKNRLLGLKGTYAEIARGYDDTDVRYVKLTDEHVHILKKPIYIESRSRWYILGEKRCADGEKRVTVFLSDDDGETWREITLENAPRFEMEPPHKGFRWQEDSCEPTIAEMPDGRLMMLVRTSQDYHYMHYSEDGGDTWTLPEPSPFHGTITMPVLERLSDGRVLLFWCNTQPLPELDKSEVYPPLDADERSGRWEDVFTNRDANHLAITSDGVEWRGFRELALNPIRNRADFRSIGGRDTRDKSVHQAELLELPYNKLLVSYGQSTESRRVVILDIDWLYETGRTENFRFGLQNLSTQMYVKSNLGNYRGFSGHCAYNRTHGALLVPDPDGNFEEALRIARVEDDALAYKKQGAVWNYPASRQGRVDIRLMRLGSGVRLSLLDRWLNPCDETVAESAFFSILTDSTEQGVWHDVSLIYDTEAGQVELLVDGVSQGVSTAKTAAPMGLSYLHIQTTADSADSLGTVVKRMAKS